MKVKKKYRQRQLFLRDRRVKTKERLKHIPKEEI